jgi:cell division septal protein FtsQ
VAPPRRATARTAALPARRAAPKRGPSKRSAAGTAGRRLWLPSGRSLLVGVAIAALAAGAYVTARQTSIFAVRTIDVVGGSPQLQQQVREELAPELGRSLVRIDGGEIGRRLSANAGVLAVRYDRAFPHTLRVFVTPERPVLLLRRGSEGWVVSARGRVTEKVRDVHASTLPRAYVPKETRVTLGSILPAQSGGLAAAVLAPLAAVGFTEPVRLVRVHDTELTLVLDSTAEVRLGDAGDLRLKLAVARRIVPLLGDGAAGSYVDVSVPERPVVGPLNSQVETTG